MEKPAKKRPKILSGCLWAVLIVMCLAAAFVMSCGLLVWATAEEMADDGAICFFVGLIGLVICGGLGFVIAYVQRKMDPALKERYKAMGCFGLTALIGMCLASAFVMLCGLIVWLAVKEDAVPGAALFFVGLLGLAFFGGIGFVMPIVQWKKGKNAPPIVEPPVSWEHVDEYDDTNDSIDDDTDFFAEYPPTPEQEAKRQRREKITTTVCVALGVAAVLFLAWWGMKGIAAAEEYRRVYKHPLCVSGVIYDHDSYDDDGDTDYRSYVRYEVNGRTYTGKYEDKDKASFLTPINTVVTVTVSPEHPEKQLREIRSDAWFIIMASLLLAMAVSAVYWLVMHGARRGGTTAFLDDEALRKNLMLTLFGRLHIMFWLLAAIVSGTLAWRYPMLYGVKTMIFTAVSASLWLIFFVSALRDAACVRRGDYEVRCDTLVEKKIISGEDSDTYRLIYRSGDEENTWKSNVSRKRYDRETIGNTVKAVYIKGKKKPTLHYDGHGEVR